MRKYLRVTPTSEQFDPERLPQALESLHKLTATDSTGLADKLNPLHSETPPRFEFLALSEGADEPVEFYYGADDHLDTLEKRLRSIYPETFDIERTEIDVASRLVQPVEFDRETFVNQYESGDLRYEFGPDEQYELATDDDSQAGPADAESAADRGTVATQSANHIIEVGDTALELAPPDAIPKDEPVTTLAKPTMTSEGTVLARPATETVSPLGVRWQGSATRKQDWMSSLSPFAGDDIDESPDAVDQPDGALASLVDDLTEASAPLAFQVVFQQRDSWQSDADVRTEDIIDGRDTRAQRFFGPLLEFDDGSEGRSREELSDTQADRVGAIEAKSAKRSFTANIRALGVPSVRTSGRHSTSDCSHSPPSSIHSMDRTTKWKPNGCATMACDRRRKNSTHEPRYSGSWTANSRPAVGRRDPISCWMAASSRTSSSFPPRNNSPWKAHAERVQNNRVGTRSPDRIRTL